MSSEILVNDEFWRIEGEPPGTCWICGGETCWRYFDIGHQHPGCDVYPKNGVHVKIMRLVIRRKDGQVVVRQADQSECEVEVDDPL